MKFIPLAEIKHLLPDNCRYKEINENTSILYFEGNQNWEAPLDLDAIVTTQYPYQAVPFILINGNLTISQIYNTNINHSTGLVILGHLKANNIVVGGQEIYIKRNLSVKEVFWGDHNCGNLIVGGLLKSRLFINTDYGVDDYRFSLKHRIEIDFLLNQDLERDVAEPTVLFHLIKPEYLYQREQLDDTIYSWKDWLNTDKIIAALAQNESILLEVPNSIYADKKYPFLFPNKGLTLDNLMKFSSGTTFNQDHHAKGEEINIEYYEGKMFKRISFINGEPNTTSIFFQYEDEYAMLIKPEKKKSLLPFSKDYIINTFYCYPSENNVSWQPMVNTSIAEALVIEWETMLEHFSDMVGISAKRRQIITPKNFLAIMQQPIVQKLGKRYYEQEDSTIFYCGQQWKFRLEDQESNHAPRITIQNYLGKCENNKYQYEYFHYELELDSKGVPFIQLYYQREAGLDADVYFLEASTRQRMLKAINYFIYLQKYIERIVDEIDDELTDEEREIQQARERGSSYLRTILGQR